MRIVGARVAFGPNDARRIDLTIAGGLIRSIGKPEHERRREIDLSGYLLLPGLINAHDHLEFNLFPRLGGEAEPRAADWMAHNFDPRKPPVEQQLQVPRLVRLAWGGIKNLLSGVTTVCHHGHYDPKAFGPRFPVRVLRRMGWAHSFDSGSDVRARFLATPRGWPFVIHISEATERASRLEIFRLGNEGVLGEKTVLVHAVGLDSNGWRLVKERRASVVWCPSSNLFMLGRTLAQSILKSHIPLALGSDSGLTADGDLLDELAVAGRVGDLSAAQLYPLVTTCAAQVLNLTKGEGSILEGGRADFLVVRDTRVSPADALLAERPRLVMIQGRIRLATPDLIQRLPTSAVSRFHAIDVQGRGPALIDADVAELRSDAEQTLGAGLHLAGKAVRPAKLSAAG